MLDKELGDRLRRIEGPFLAARVAAHLRVEPPLLDLDDVSQEPLVDVAEDARVDLRVVDRTAHRLSRELQENVPEQAVVDPELGVVQDRIGVEYGNGHDPNNHAATA